MERSLTEQLPLLVGKKNIILYSNPSPVVLYRRWTSESTWRGAQDGPKLTRKKLRILSKKESTA